MDKNQMNKEIEAIFEDIKKEQEIQREKAREIIIDSCKNICEAAHKDDSQLLSDSIRNLLNILDMVEVWK